LDFFTTKPAFDSKTILVNFLNNSDWKTNFVEETTIYGELFGAKVSFIAYPFFIPKQDLVQ